MTQVLVALRTGETAIQDIPTASTTGAVARGADATHVDSAAVTAHVDSAPVLMAAAQMSAPAPAGGAALALPAASIAPVSSSIQSSSPVTAIIASDSHTDSGSDGVVGRSASFELPFTHEVASGADAVGYVMQDDGSIVVTDADSGPIIDWAIIV
jgi:hypothetical protein